MPILVMWNKPPGLLCFFSCLCVTHTANSVFLTYILRTKPINLHLVGVILYLPPPHAHAEREWINLTASNVFLFKSIKFCGCFVNMQGSWPLRHHLSWAHWTVTPPIHIICAALNTQQAEGAAVLLSLSFVLFTEAQKYVWAQKFCFSSLLARYGISF